jgi:hypothetical protein
MVAAWYNIILLVSSSPVALDLVGFHFETRSANVVTEGHRIYRSDVKGISAFMLAAKTFGQWNVAGSF